MYGMYELTKPRLSLLSVLQPHWDTLSASPCNRIFRFYLLTIGTAFAAGGAAALNQWMSERKTQ